MEVGERYPEITDANVKVISSPLGPIVLAQLKPFHPTGDIMVFFDDQVVSLYPKARRPFHHMYSMFMISSTGYEVIKDNEEQTIYIGSSPTGEKFQIFWDKKNNMVKFTIPAEGEGQTIRKEEHEDGRAFIVQGLAVICDISEVKEESFSGKKFLMIQGPTLDIYIRLKENPEPQPPLI